MMMRAGKKIMVKKHAERDGGGVQEGGTWLDREIGHNPADWLVWVRSQNSVTNSVTNFSGGFVRQGISRIQLKHTRGKSLEMATITQKLWWVENTIKLIVQCSMEQIVFWRAALEVVSVKFLIWKWNHSEYCLNFAPRQFPSLKWKFPAARISLLIEFNLGCFSFWSKQNSAGLRV